MDFSEIEIIEQKFAMNPHAAENGGSSIHNGSTKQARGVFSQKLNHFPYGLSNNRKEKLHFTVLTASLAILILLIILIVFSILLSGRSTVLPTTLPSPSIPTECCSNGWIGYQRKCYYFSDSDRNWTYSQNYCASFNASLVMIDSQEEMSFLRRFKGPVDHWIGLQRMDDQAPWRWIDGTIFNNWFEIQGGGKSAYIYHQGVASSSGRNEEPWICSKPVHKSERTVDAGP